MFESQMEKVILQTFLEKRNGLMEHHADQLGVILSGAATTNTSDTLTKLGLHSDSMERSVCANIADDGIDMNKDGQI